MSSGLSVFPSSSVGGKRKAGCPLHPYLLHLSLLGIERLFPPLIRDCLRLQTQACEAPMLTSASLQIHNVIFFTTSPNYCLPASTRTSVAISKSSYLTLTLRVPPTFLLQTLCSHPCSANLSLPQQRLCKTLIKNSSPESPPQLSLPFIPSLSVIDRHLRGRSHKEASRFYLPVV